MMSDVYFRDAAITISMKYERASLAVQKENFAVKMYENVGFTVKEEKDQEYIMVCEL